MALLDEQLVEECLNRNHFFIMRGIKCGVDEIDLLAIKHVEDTQRSWSRLNWLFQKGWQE